MVDGILETMSERSREKDISGLLLRPCFRKDDIRLFLSLHKKRSGGAKRGGATKSDLVRQFVMEDLLREKDLASLSSPSVTCTDIVVWKPLSDPQPAAFVEVPSQIVLECDIEKTKKFRKNCT